MLGTSAPTQEAVVQLTTYLVRALRCLGEADEPETAVQIAAEAYAAIRRKDALAAEQLNQVMHYLTRLEGNRAPLGKGAQ